MLSICLNHPSEPTGSEAFPAPSGHLGRHRDVRSLILSPAQGQRHRTIPGHPWLWNHPRSSAEMFIYGTALSLGVSTGSGILWDALWAWNILYSVFSAAAEGTGIQGFRNSGIQEFRKGLGASLELWRMFSPDCPAPPRNSWCFLASLPRLGCDSLGTSLQAPLCLSPCLNYTSSSTEGSTKEEINLPLCFAEVLARCFELKQHHDKKAGVNRAPKI